jgi:hypothetical protein
MKPHWRFLQFFIILGSNHAVRSIYAIYCNDAETLSYHGRRGDCEMA